MYKAYVIAHNYYSIAKKLTLFNCVLLKTAEVN